MATPKTGQPAGRPRKFSDEELLLVLLEEPSPARAATRLGVDASTVRAHLRLPGMRDLLVEHRRQAVDVAAAAVQESVADAIATLRELMAASSPQDSVRLGAASALLKLARDVAKADSEREERDDVWDAAPEFKPRLIQGGGGDGDPSPA